MGKEKPKTNVSSFLDALRFISPAQKPEGAPHQRHVRLFNGQAIAFDGVIAIGHPIIENFNVCPQTNLLIQALNKCSESVTFTQLDSGRLSVKSGKFRAFVPCFPAHEMQGAMPDPAVGPLDDRIAQGFGLLNPVVVEGSQHVLTASLCLKNGSMVATNRHVILEFWHGNHLPPIMLLPKAFINIVSKATKKLVSFGFSQNSFTVYYEDNSWVKTQLYMEKYPDIDRVLSIQSNQYPVPENFFEGVHNILPFVDQVTPNIYLRGNRIQTHSSDDNGAYFEVANIPPRGAFNAKNLILISPHVKTIDFAGSDKGALFFGDNMRGAISHVIDKD